MPQIKEQFITDIKGNKISIILPIKKFENIKADLHDLAMVAERKNEKTISLDEMKSKFLK